MTCNNSGTKTTAIISSCKPIYMLEGEGLHPENWCLDCIQGKNPVKEQFDIPDEWR